MCVWLLVKSLKAAIFFGGVAKISLSKSIWLNFMRKTDTWAKNLPGCCCCCSCCIMKPININLPHKHKHTNTAINTCVCVCACKDRARNASSLDCLPCFPVVDAFVTLMCSSRLLVKTKRGRKDDIRRGWQGPQQDAETKHADKGSSVISQTRNK